MRVVSQSKDVSLDFDRAVFTANHGMITAMVDGKTFTIGTYANLGREKEVFSDMHKAFPACNRPCYQIQLFPYKDHSSQRI